MFHSTMSGTPDSSGVEMSPVPSGRIASVDLMEALAIVMACSLHYPLFPIGSFISEVWQLLCMGAVPSFFLINGYLLFSKPFSWRKHISRVKNVVFGIIFWKSLILVIFSLVGTFDTAQLTLSLLLNYYCTAITLGSLPSEHIWFMYALLSIYILFPLFKLMFDLGYKRYIWLTIGLGILTVPFAVDIDWVLSSISVFMGGSYQPCSEITNAFSSIFPFGPWGIYLVYFLMGPFVWPLIDNFAKNCSSLTLGLFAAAVISISVALALLQDWVYHGQIVWVGNVIPDQYKHFATIGVCFGLLAASRSISLPVPLNKLVALISKNTLSIYYLHMPVLFILTISIAWPNSFVLNLIRTLGVVAASTFVGVILKRIPMIRKFS